MFSAFREQPRSAALTFASRGIETACFFSESTRNPAVLFIVCVNSVGFEIQNSDPCPIGFNKNGEFALHILMSGFVLYFAIVT
jgi:hypothetical protein